MSRRTAYPLLATLACAECNRQWLARCKLLFDVQKRLPSIDELVFEHQRYRECIYCGYHDGKHVMATVVIIEKRRTVKRVKPVQDDLFPATL